MSGKGHAPRPYSVDTDTFAANWDAIFKKDEQKEELTDEQRIERPASND